MCNDKNAIVLYTFYQLSYSNFEFTINASKESYNIMRY